MSRAAALALLLWTAAARAATPDAHPPTSTDTATLLAAAANADWALRLEGTCDRRHLEALQKAVDALDAAWAGPRATTADWPFPVARVSPAASIGGTDGNGFRMPRRLACYAGRDAGHPAHDLFVPDPDFDWQDTDGRPWTVHAVEPGVVVVARTGWKPGDASRGGHYVMLYLPARRAVVYYAHLDRVDVVAGQRVDAGATLGTVGRTGWNAWPKRSPTHLHFAFWSLPSWLPVDPYPRLKTARQHPGTAPTASSGTSP